MRSYLLHYGAPLLGLALLAPATASADHYSGRSYYGGGWDAPVSPLDYRSRHGWDRSIHYGPTVHYGYRGHHRGNYRINYRGHHPRYGAPRPYIWQPHRARHDLIYRQPFGRIHHLPHSSLDVTVRYRIRH